MSERSDGWYDGYKRAEQELGPTLTGLKTTIERLEESHVRKDQKIKELENELIGVRKALSDTAWQLANIPEERIDW